MRPRRTFCWALLLCKTSGKAPKGVPTNLFGSVSLTKRSQVHLSRFMGSGSCPMRRERKKKKNSSTRCKAHPLIYQRWAKAAGKTKQEPFLGNYDQLLLEGCKKKRLEISCKAFISELKHCSPFSTKRKAPVWWRWIWGWPIHGLCESKQLL